MSDVQINNVVMYKSIQEDDNVAFDIIRKDISRDYFRIGSRGMNFLRATNSTLEIIGVDMV